MSLTPITILLGPRPSLSDAERDGSLEADGILTGVIAELDTPVDAVRTANNDYFNGTGSALVRGQEVMRLSAIPVPAAYDEAGVAYPPGSLLLLACASMTMSFLRMANAGVPTVGISPVTFRKHFVKRWLVILGLPAATTGTVKLRRTSDWQTGSPTADEITVAIDGAAGPDQWVPLPDVSAPADQRRAAWLYYETTWTGTAPLREYLSAQTAQVIALGRVVPDTLPSGYTQVVEPQCEVFGAPLWHPPGRWHAHDRATPSMSPLNRGFTRGSFATGHLEPNSPTAASDGLPSRFGQPHLGRIAALPYATFPCLWIGAALREQAWLPWCPLLQEGVNTAIVASTPFATTITTAYTLLDGGPGWREVTAWAHSASNPGFITSITLEIARTANWATGTPTVLIGTIAWTGAEAVGSAGTVRRLGADITPSPDRFDSYIYVRLVVVVTNAAAATVDIRASRRCDIPSPWPAAGPGGDLIPGGYKAGLLGDPTNLALVVHGGVGDTVASFLHPGAGEVRNYVASFLPPSDGVWRAAYSVTPALACTCGAYEQTFNRRTSHLGRAGKRFWGAVDAVLNGGGVRTDTLTLTAVTLVQTAVPSGAGGLTLNSGHATDSQWTFLRIDLPAAGRYRIHLEGTAGVAAFLGLSLTDPYAIDPDASAVREWYNFGPVVSETATPPGSPANGARYLIASGATGAWAGEDGQVAHWDANRGAWRIIRPDYANHGFVATTSSPAATRWRNPGEAAWRTGVGEVAALDVTVAAAQTAYLRVGKHDPDGATASDSILSGGVGTPRIWWELL